MASYSATIEVGTRGTAALEKLLARVNTLSGSIDKVNRNPVFGSKQVASLNEYNRTLKEATANLAKTRVVLDKSGQAAGNYAKAIKDYVDALGLANGAQDLTNKLVQQEIQGREKATAALKKYNAAAASARQPGGSMTGSYLRGGGGVSRTGVASGGSSQYSSPIGPDPSFVFSGQSTAVGGRIKAIKAAQAAMVAAETEVNRVTRTFEQQETAREKANDKLIFDRKMALLDAEHQKILKLNKKENDAALKNFDQRLSAQTKKRAAQTKAQAGRSRKFTDIATGAGFPLLFGGGPIQALAGGLGGAAGGLGGAIAASALTAQVEAFAKEAAKVGQALNSTSGALELVREKSLFSSEQIKERALQLEEQGRVEELAALLTGELTQLIGNEGVRSLQQLGSTTDETTRLWSQLTLQLQALVAGPLNDFLLLINKFLGEQGNRAQLSLLEKDLAGTDAGSKLAAEIERLQPTSKVLRQGETRTIKGVLAPSDVENLLKTFGSSRPKSTASIPVTAQDRRDFSVSGGRAKKDVVPGLKIQVQLQERLLGLNTKIAEARRDGNEGAAAVLEVEKIFEQTAANINKIKAEGLDKEAETLKIRSEELNGLQQVEAVNNRMRDAEAKKAEKVKETVSSLQDEGALLQAKLDGSETEVALKQKIAQATKDLSAEDAKRVENLIRANALLSEQVKIADQTNQVYAQIGQTIQSGIVGGIQSAIDGSKSLGESLSGILKQLGGIFLQAGIGSLGIGGQTGSGLLGLLPFAEGGYVSGPTPALVGEGGEPEYVIPESKMRESMSRYSRGSRGSSVIPEVGASGTSGDGGIAVAAPIDVRYTVERINSVDYVTADQFQNGLQSAAAQGAQRGEQNTLKRLQMSGSARKRIGL
ncbi:phage tail tape measure protein [uncultured Mediterranean phage uvMED]|nr:phage tail tape measure protein [uncultured Mediterranean phage uvMED]